MVICNYSIKQPIVVTGKLTSLAAREFIYSIVMGKKKSDMRERFKRGRCMVKECIIMGTEIFMKGTGRITLEMALEHFTTNLKEKPTKAPSTKEKSPVKAFSITHQVTNMMATGPIIKNTAKAPSSTQVVPSTSENELKTL